MRSNQQIRDQKLFFLPMNYLTNTLISATNKGKERMEDGLIWALMKFYILHFGSSIIHGSIWNTWSSFVVMVQQYEYILVWGFERQLPNAYLKRSWSFKMLDVKINKILILLLQLKQLSEACCPKIIVDSWLKYNQTVPSWSKAKD